MSEDEAAEKFPIGQRVRFFPRLGGDEFFDTTIRSKPWTLGHGAVVIAIESHTGGVAVEHLLKLTKPK